MAADVSEVEGAAPAASTRGPRRRRRPRPYRLRFVLLYGALATALGAGIAGVVLLAGTGGGPGGSAWSSWSPTDSGSARTKQIVDHVSRTYRLPGGDQLVAVEARPPAVQNVPIKAVAVRGSGGSGDEVSLLDEGNSLMFVLCGLGQSCSIAKGKPTIERGRLVRREALELALYSFKFEGNLKYVIAFMPPPRGKQPESVVYFRRADLEQELGRPLARTLAPKTPTQDTITPVETATIDRLTQSRLFKFQLQQAQQGDAILVLDPAA